MTTGTRPLANAPAWIFLASSAAAATILAALAILAGPAPVAPAPPVASFSTAKLRDSAAPATASKPASPGHDPLPKVAMPQRSGFAPAAPTVATAPAAGSPPLRAITADPSLATGSGAMPAEAKFGTRHTNEMTLGELRIPLPPGEWRVAADVPLASGRDVGLVLESGKLVAAVLIASYSNTGNGVGYPASRVCTRRMMRGNTEKNEDFGEQSCWSSAIVTVKGLTENIGNTGVGKALRGDLEAQGLSFTTEAVLDTWFVLSNTKRRVLLTVFHNPEAEGLEPIKLERIEEGPWSNKNLGQNPQNAKYIRERLQWASQAHQQLKQSFNAVP